MIIPILAFGFRFMMNPYCRNLLWGTLLVFKYRGELYFASKIVTPLLTY